MDFSDTEEQRLIRTSAAELVRRLVPPERVRALFAADAPAYCPDLWRGLAEAGYLGTLVPGDGGGAGLGFVEMGCVLEALGGVLASGPYLSSSVVAVEALRLAADEEQQGQWLPAIASGEKVLCPMIDDQTGGGFAPVAYAHTADALLVASGGHLHIVDPTAVGVAIDEFPSLDPTRHFAAVAVSSAALAAAARLAGPIDAAMTARLMAVGAAATAAEMLGVASRAHELACAYAKERQQFGKPIGSFQAIKHLLADQRVALEGARSAVYAALWALDGDPAGATVAAAVAKTAMSEVALRIGAEAIQVHGGMGFTDEVDAHLYLKRAQMDAMAYGTSDHHGRLLAERLRDLAQWTRLT